MRPAYVKYDFTDLEKALSKLYTNQSYSTLNDIKKELNRFFKDSNCEQVIFTNNTDKFFFGMCVIPILKDETAVDKIIASEEKVRLYRYYVEIDSKLLLLGLNPSELTAVLLHEVGHMVNNGEPIEELRKNIDVYFDTYDTNVDSVQLKKAEPLIKYGITDALRKLTSIFYRRDEEIIADQFVVACGYGEELESAFKKISKNSFKINKEVTNKFIVLKWSFNIYKELKWGRIRALHVMKDSLSLTSSKLEKKQINDVIDVLNDKKVLVDESYVHEFGFFSTLRRKMRAGGIRDLEDELYEYNIRVKNVDDEEEALAIIRRINSRIAIIEDYISSEENLSEQDRKRWFNLIDKYRLLRDQLSNKTTYSEKYYGLFTKIPVTK